MKSCIALLVLAAVAALAPARRGRRTASDRDAPGRRQGSERRRDPQRHGRRQGNRRGDRRTSWCRRSPPTARASPPRASVPAGPLRGHRELSRLREPDADRRPRARRRQPARRHAADREGRGERRRRARSGDLRVRSEERSLQQRAVEGSDRGAARRSRRNGEGAEGDGGARARRSAWTASAAASCRRSRRSARSGSRARCSPPRTTAPATRFVDIVDAARARTAARQHGLHASATAR